MFARFNQITRKVVRCLALMHYHVCMKYDCELHCKRERAAKSKQQIIAYASAWTGEADGQGGRKAELLQSSEKAYLPTYSFWHSLSSVQGRPKGRCRPFLKLARRLMIVIFDMLYTRKI